MRLWLSRTVHAAVGLAGTGAALLSQQHVSTPFDLRQLEIRCCVLFALWGLAWEYVIQAVVADLRPGWNWSRKADPLAAAAFPIGALAAAIWFARGM
jgi:hypothetical protein